MGKNTNNIDFEDMAYRTREEDVDFKLIRMACNRKMGRGWKRRLADIAEVPKATVHGWIDKGKMPPWLHLMQQLAGQVSALRENERLMSRQVEDFRRTHLVVQGDDGYAVYSCEEDIGKLVVKGIKDIETAREIAALPRLKSFASDLHRMLKELIDEVGDYDWESLDETTALDNFDQWNALRSLKVELTDPEDIDVVGGVKIMTDEFAKGISRQQFLVWKE